MPSGRRKGGGGKQSQAATYLLCKCGLIRTICNHLLDFCLILSSLHKGLSNRILQASNPLFSADQAQGPSLSALLMGESTAHAKCLFEREVAGNSMEVSCDVPPLQCRRHPHQQQSSFWNPPSAFSSPRAISRLSIYWRHLHG